ncbi:hypothetical protein [Ferruginibacter profundus]
MKIFKSVILVLATAITFFSCQKELIFENTGVSVGTFKKDAGGNCLPVTVTGVFKVDSAITNALFVDVQINVTTPGTFEIKSDTINGFSFSRTGSVVFGNNTIRLYGSGKPIAAGLNMFTVKYGTSTCSFNITVINSGTSNAVFTLDGAPGICASASAAGTYTVGVALTPANTLTIQVNVTTTGTYAIGAATTSGFLFTGSGVFNITGVQNVTLTGSGTPVIAGTASVSVLNLGGTNSCTYDIPVLAGTGGGGGGGGTGGASRYYFQFNDGTKLIAADTSSVIAMSLSLGGLTQLSVQAFSVTGDSALQLGVAATGSPVIGVTYKTSNIGVPIALFNVLSTINGQVYQADVSTIGKNIDIKFDVIDVVNKIVSGTFSGTANGISTGATITNGKFRAELQ